MIVQNRLADASSLYLLQHAANPVDWWPWGPDAFGAARSSGRPILLSVGYSACHWCHVMAHESFEDSATAALMNELFVNIKVDREERPDVDQVYMSALHTLGQQGGWPLTMFLTADGEPFWGGTYFPKTPRYGQPAFVDVLRSIAKAYQTRRADIATNAGAILNALKTETAPATSSLSLDFLDRLTLGVVDLYDPDNGGLRGAPKFPNPPVLEFLWRAADRTGDESVRAPVLLTLERMCRGGIFDQVDGGFARYSVDTRWLVPHFEKMLYDNAQLLPLLALAGRATSSPLLLRAADRTVQWLLDSMLTPSGAFAASLDADSRNPDGHLEEGAYYVWRPQEVRDCLGDAADSILAAFDITPAGNFDGLSIPNQLHIDGLSAAPDLRLDAALLRLKSARHRRPSPGRDDKILADWNGLMITGLARAADLMDQPVWRSAACRAYAAVVDCLGCDSKLGHAWRAGKAVFPGFALDYAAMALAAVTLAESTGEPGYRSDAERWLTVLLADYTTPGGTLAMTERAATDLPLRPEPTNDDAVPNANAVAVEALVRLAAAGGQAQWHEAADRLLAAQAAAVRANPFGHAAALNALDLRLRRADVVITGADADVLFAEARAVAYPNRTLVKASNAGSLPDPAMTASPIAAAYVCAEGRCSLPLHTPAELRLRIEEAARGRPR